MNTAVSPCSVKTSLAALPQKAEFDRMLEDGSDQQPVTKTKMVHFYFANPFNTRDQGMRMVYEPTAEGMHHWKCGVGEVGGGGESKKEKNLALWLLLKKKYHTFPECPTPSPLTFQMVHFKVRFQQAPGFYVVSELQPWYDLL